MQQFEIDNQLKMLENQQNIVNAIKDLVIVAGLLVHATSSNCLDSDKLTVLANIIQRNMK